METQHMNQQTFAKLTGISSATLSSTFTGRTSPTLNHVLAIQARFPNINLNWLLHGEGGMFIPASTEQDKVVSGDTSQESFDSPSGNDHSAIHDIMAEGVLDFGSSDTVVAPVQSNNNQTGLKGVSRQNSIPNSQNVSRGISLVSSPSKKISEIRVFYDDQTWESFVPKK